MRPFSVLVDEASSTNIGILMCPSRLASDHLWGCLVLQGVSSKTLAFQKNIEGSALLLGVPLRLMVSDVFRRRLQRCWRNCWLFLRKLAWLFFPISSRRCQLWSTGCCFCPLFSVGCLVGLSSLGSLIKSFSKILGETDLQLQAISWEVFSLTSVFVVPWRISVQWDFFPSIRQAFFWSRIYSFCEEDQIT